MLKLSSRIMLDGKRKMAVTLPTNMNYFPKNRTNAYVDGWGTNPENTDHLLRTNIYTISAEECVTGVDLGRDRNYQICTLDNSGAGPCPGDSGGPKLRADDGVQIGIVPFLSLNCENEAGIMSIFTSVASNLDWIRSIMMERDGEKNQQESETGTVPANNKPTMTNFFGLPLGHLIPLIDHNCNYFASDQQISQISVSNKNGPKMREF